MKQEIKLWQLAIAVCFIGLLVWGLVQVSFQRTDTVVAKPALVGDLVTSRTPDAIELELLRRNPKTAHLFPADDKSKTGAAVPTGTAAP